jgi:hypothetical protein
MDSQSLISLARTQAHTSDTIVSDSEALTLLNIVYHDVVNTIKRDVWEDFLYQTWEIDAETGITAYPFNENDSTEDNIDKIRNVFIKYSDTSDYIKATHVLASSLEKIETYYAEFQPENDPIFYVQNDTLRIFPAPKEDVIDGIILGSLMRIKDITLLSAENDILVPREFHTTLLHGLMWHFFQRRGLTNDEEFYRQKYKDSKRDMVRDMSDQVQWPHYVTLPDLNKYD